MAGGGDDVRARLESVAEDLADLALDRLRAAVDAADAGERAGASAEERRFTRARRAVEKAAAILAEPPSLG